jgi:hypothetical protein
VRANLSGSATVRVQWERDTMDERPPQGRAGARRSRRRNRPIRRIWRVGYPVKDPTRNGTDDFATRFEAEEHAEMWREWIKRTTDVYGPDDWHQVFVSEIH